MSAVAGKRRDKKSKANHQEVKMQNKFVPKMVFYCLKANANVNNVGDKDRNTIQTAAMYKPKSSIEERV